MSMWFAMESEYEIHGIRRATSKGLECHDTVGNRRRDCGGDWVYLTGRAVGLGRLARRRYRAGLAPLNVGPRLIFAVLIFDSSGVLKGKGNTMITYRYNVEESINDGEALIMVDGSDGEVRGGAMFILDADGTLTCDTDSDGCKDNPFDSRGWPEPPEKYIREARELAVGHHA